ncbi:MAG TPA: PAS domain S-box protein [Chitinophagaceae bacterium]|nr:PAS domain S-box protein [Chitinophagaceae bacterium]
MSGILVANTIADNFASLANAMPQLVWIAEADGSVYYYNDRISEFQGAELLPSGQWQWKGLLHPEDQKPTEEAWQRAVLNGTVYEMEHRIITKAGQFHWYLSRAFPQKDEHGKVIRWYGTATDVHHQKEVQELLRLSEVEFRTMFEASIVGMAQAYSNGRLLRVNDAFCELTGYSREELEKFRFSDITHPEDREEDFQRYENMINGLDKRYFSEKRYIRKDGAIVWVMVTATPVFDNKGNFKHTIAVIQNITDRKNVEQANEKLATHLKIATDSARAGTWYHDLVTGSLEWSDQHKDLWGLDRKKTDLRYEDWYNNIYAEDLKIVFASLDHARDHHTLYEAQYRIKRADNGATSWVQSIGQFRYNEKDEAIAVTGISVDITDNKNSQKELLELKEQLELTVRNVPAGIMLLNRNQEIVFANDKAAWFLKVDRVADLMSDKDISSLHKIGKRHFNVFDKLGNEMDESSSPVKRAFATGKTSEDVFRIEFRNNDKTKWIVYSCNPVLDDHGETMMVLATITDITSQKEAEQLIRQSEEQLRFLAESIPQLVWMADEKGNCEYKTGRWFEYSGLEQDDDDILDKMLHPDDRERIGSLWRESLTTRQAFRDEARLKNRNGEYRWHAVSGEPIRNAEGNVFKWIGVFTDIDEQKTSAEKLELLVALRTTELKRSNEDLQQFAHVASHDLKEPLRKIKIFGSRLNDDPGTSLSDKAKLYLSKIEGAASRMETMIEGVLQYSSLNAKVQLPEKVDLNGVLENILSDLEISIQQSGAIINYQDLPVIDGAPVLIYQLLYNLVNNSLKFRPEGQPPRINISSEILKIQENSFLKLVIEDNGIGFEMEYAESIFNSFSRLNSKDRYEGTGLGLALCKKIVERHNGTIEAWGELNKGARFTVYLPVSQFGRMI